MSGISHAGASARLARRRSMPWHHHRARPRIKSGATDSRAIVTEARQAIVGVTDSRASSRNRRRRCPGSRTLEHLHGLVAFVPCRGITTVRGPGSSPGRQEVVCRNDEETKRRRDIAQLRAITPVRGPGSSPGRRTNKPTGFLLLDQRFIMAGLLRGLVAGCRLFNDY